MLGELGLTARRIATKGPELQSDDLGEIAIFAAREASTSCGRPLIVEDTGLFITSLGGFPGPYANYAYRTLGLEGILRMLRGSSNRDAKFESVVAYCGPEGRPRLFRGSLLGRIGSRATGSSGFGFDPIFVPRGEERTLAEMTLARKCSLSHRAIATRKFGEWYLRSVPGQRL